MVDSVTSRKQLILLLSFILLCLPNFCLADINTSLKRYHNTAPSQQQLSNVQRYDHLIRYFTGFSYFVPRHKVSPNFIKALIIAESAGNPRAVSHKNALGLGQILYSTGKEAAKELSRTTVRFRYINQDKLKDLKKEDLFDPAINILLTCYLIAKYNYKFEGKIELVLSAWNAGEYTDSLTKMQHAPYKETENLIGKVNGYYLYLLNNRY